jgi:hypothetical protein
VKSPAVFLSSLCSRDGNVSAGRCFLDHKFNLRIA